MVSFPGKGVILTALILWAAVGGTTASSQMFAPQTAPKESTESAPQIKADKQGRKTLVINEKNSPAQRFAPPIDEKQETKTLATDDNNKSGPKSPQTPQVPPAQIKVDGQGRKILISREDGVGMSQPSQNQENTRSYVKHPPPYWEATPEVSEKPYFLATATVDTSPYWQVDNKTTESLPYWTDIAKESSSRPYWAPPIKPRDADAVVVPILPPDKKGYKTIAYYMHTDENGTRHITNTQHDSRYKLFSFQVKIEVNFQRGLAGVSSRFTHHTLRPIIMKAARTYNLDPALIAGVIRSESAFDANAVSWAGAQGLMQLMPGTSKDMGVRNPFDPEDNVMGGSRYLRKMLNLFNGDLTLALAAYNSGPGRVSRLGRVPNIPETKNYVIIVKRNYDRYKGQF